MWQNRTYSNISQVQIKPPKRIHGMKYMVKAQQITDVLQVKSDSVCCWSLLGSLQHQQVHSLHSLTLHRDSKQALLSCSPVTNHRKCTARTWASSQDVTPSRTHHTVLLFLCQPLNRGRQVACAGSYKLLVQSLRVSHVRGWTFGTLTSARRNCSNSVGLTGLALIFASYPRF